MISIEEYRCRIGRFIRIRGYCRKKPSHGVSVSRDLQPSRANVLTVSLLSVLLLIGGVEPNPGPKSAHSVQQDGNLSPLGASSSSQGKASAHYLWHSDWAVVQPAQVEANLQSNIPSQLAVSNYIDKEFSVLTNQHSSGVISVPAVFPISQQPSEGERAEMVVFNLLKGVAKKIPDMKVVFFHGLSFTGERIGMPGKVIREMDFAIFIRYLGKHFTSAFEVKCCGLEKGLKEHRKKAHNQLTTYKSILQQDHSFSEDSVNKVQLHTVWPFLTRWEACMACKGKHQRFKEKPKECVQPGTQPAQYEPQGWHIFKEDTDPLSFEVLLRSLVQPMHEMTLDPWIKLLMLHTQLSCGSLYDEYEKEFYLLGQDQNSILRLPDHDLRQPIMVEGIAGTGKTLTIAAKIEALHQQRKLTTSSRAIYVAFSDHMLEHMHLLLTKAKVDLSFLEMKNASKDLEIKSCFFEQKKMDQMIASGMRYFFIDEAEDLGYTLLQQLAEPHLEPGHTGFFLVTFDYNQCRQEQHSLEAAHLSPVSIDELSTNQLKWKGRTLESNKMKCVGALQTLKTVFRMTQNIASHIDEKHLIPKMEIGYHMKHDIKGVKCSEDQINITDPNNVKSLVNQYIRKLVNVTASKNLHPGHIAILFPDDDFEIIFGTKVCYADFLNKLRHSIESMYFETKNKIQPAVTSNLHDSIFFSHKPDLKHCRCKFYIGNIDSVKGLTVRVVYYFVLTASLDSSFPTSCPRVMERTWPHYSAASRASCEFHLIKLCLPSIISPSIQQSQQWNKHIRNIITPTYGATEIDLPNRSYSALPSSKVNLPASAATVLVKHPSDVRCFAWNRDVHSGDESMASSGSLEGTFFLVDTSTVVRELELEPGPVRDIITCVAWGAKGTLLATGSVRGSVTIWEKQGDLFEGELLKPDQMAWPDEDIQIKAINNHRWCFDKSGDRQVNDIAFNEASSSILTSRANYCCEVWDVSSRSCIQQFWHHANVLTAIWLDNRSFVSAANKKFHFGFPIEQWTVEMKVQKFPTSSQLAGHTETVTSLCWDPLGKILASGSHDKTIRLWAPESSSSSILSILVGHRGRVQEVIFKPNSNPVKHKSSLQTLGSWDTCGQAMIWNIKEATCLHTFDTISDTMNTYLWSRNNISFSKDRNLLSCRGQTVCVWDIEKGNLVAECQVIQCSS